MQPQILKLVQQNVLAAQASHADAVRCRAHVPAAAWLGGVGATPLPQDRGTRHAHTLARSSPAARWLRRLRACCALECLQPGAAFTAACRPPAPLAHVPATACAEHCRLPLHALCAPQTNLNCNSLAHVSYTCRFCASPSTSNAACSWPKAAGSPPLSGCSRFASWR